MASKAFKSIVDLCRNLNHLIDSDLLAQLKCILTEHPSVVHEKDEFGFTLLHYAAMYQSVEFCKQIVELNAGAVKLLSRRCSMPVHLSCHDNHNNIETTKYLFQLHPESINIPDSDGNYPIHLLLLGGYRKNILELTQFLLKHDKGSVSKPNHCGNLPLHIACQLHELNIVKLILDSYAEAINIKNKGGWSCLDMAKVGPDDEDDDDILRLRYHDEVECFLELQLDYIREAHERTTPDSSSGRLPLHKAVCDRRVSVGTVQLIISANPASIDTADNLGRIPLHMACLVGEADVVKYLIEVDQNSHTRPALAGNCGANQDCFVPSCNDIDRVLNKTYFGMPIRTLFSKLDIVTYLKGAHKDSLARPDMGGDCALHLACCMARYNTISCILDNSYCGVSVRNAYGKLPVQYLLTTNQSCERNGPEYVGAVYQLLRAYPALHDILDLDAMSEMGNKTSRKETQQDV